ncbi:hypothetical protein [Virgibacillus proomii]|uniref:hypothetical protein n=1 Tax=Virgibacillus proomii TaxID=84407 RepID=UPI001C10B65A|nr:hypothetical protein [Virgibacillus proomii]MBU5266253.1 hypothetical protein [Virgibacillus proomii]
MAKRKYKIPFYEGNLQSYPYIDDEWRDNYVFEGTLEYKTYHRGRSSVTIEFSDSKGNTYGMFVSDFDDLVNRKGLNGKKVHGKWTFVKKGQNYGIRLCEDDE